MSETTFIANGTFEIVNFPADSAIVALTGGFGGGTVTLSVKEGNRGTDLVLDTATAAYVQTVDVGMGNDFKATLAGASGSFSLLIQIIPKRS